MWFRTFLWCVTPASGISLNTYASWLMPVPVPLAVWSHTDFVEALPCVGGKLMILTVIDRFNEYCHFLPLAHPYTAESMAQTFFLDVVHLRRMPQSMVSNQDPIFTST